jgi:hypothetical protein
MTSLSIWLDRAARFEGHRELPHRKPLGDVVVSACVDSCPEGDNPTASGTIRRSTIEEATEDRLWRSG